MTEKTKYRSLKDYGDADIVAAFKAAKGNQAAAARRLGLRLADLRRRVAGSRELTEALTAARGGKVYEPAVPPQHDEDEIEAALRAARGIISVACKRLGITHRQRLLGRIETSDRLRRAREEALEGLKDEAENKLFEYIEHGGKQGLTAIIFFLKCRAKDRGYIDRQEITGRDGEPLYGDVGRLSDDQRRQLEDLSDGELARLYREKVAAPGEVRGGPAPKGGDEEARLH